jgi:hypothetical protein
MAVPQGKTMMTFPLAAFWLLPSSSIVSALIVVGVIQPPALSLGVTNRQQIGKPVGIETKLGHLLLESTTSWVRFKASHGRRHRASATFSSLEFRGPAPNRWRS